MTTKEESKELTQEPLPVTVGVMLDYVTNCPAERVLSHILLIDEETEKIRQALTPYLAKLESQRNQLLDRARKEGITENADAVLLTIEGRKERNDIDLESFALTYPDQLKQIREDQRKAITDKQANLLKAVDESAIPLTMADKKIGKDAVTAFVGYQPVKVTYEVRRK